MSSEVVRFMTVTIKMRMTLFPLTQTARRMDGYMRRADVENQVQPINTPP